MSAAISTRKWVITLLLIVSALSAYAIGTRLRLDPNVAALLPERGESAQLRRYLAAFGGSDLAIVLVNGEDTAAVEACTRQLAEKLQALQPVRVAADRLDVRGQLDPMLVWRHADAAARVRLEQALTPDGMASRLRGTRSMKLAPGGGASDEILMRDPLRLAQLLYEDRNVDTGFKAQADGSFASDDGRNRLVLVFPRGQALRGEDAKAFVEAAEAVIEAQRAAHPGLYIGLTGGHAIAAATEQMIVRDMTISGSLSLVLAALAFLLTFRRIRALVAVMVPLTLGTLWTAGIAATLPAGLSAIAVGFMSVVFGVGVDTGVHVYTALLEARRDGLSPADAARRARRLTARPVLVAALTAGVAFGALALSDIRAVRQLGILCAGGELLTAIAIVVVTPEIGARLERSTPPAAPKVRWADVVVALTRSRARALTIVGLCFLPVVALAVGYGPQIADAIVAVRPQGLEPLQTQQRVYDAFGGRTGQWVVLVADSERERARERVDRIAEKLATMTEHVEAIDGLTALAPAPKTQRTRLAERDRLNLPEKADLLEDTLENLGFNVGRFEEALEGMRSPSSDLVSLDALAHGNAEIMVRRYLGFDAGEHVVVLYVLPKRNPSSERLVEEAVRTVDPTAAITGYSRLDRGLRDSLKRDFPRIGLVAGLLVIAALLLALRGVREVLIAGSVVVVEIAAVVVLIRVFDVPLHVYDALVLPVLLGITVDEGMFLLHRARRSRGPEQIRETLRHEGPPVVTTALTTAAGFGGLVWCDFDGLRHLGMVGALGSITGLVVALLLVPAALRLTQRAA